jgi:hypothetical protein
MMRIKLVIAFASVVFLATVPVDAANSSQNSQDAHRLTPGTPIEREIAGNETHTYLITLAANQFIRISVSQREVDVAVLVFGIDGQPRAESNSRRRSIHQ